MRFSKASAAVALAAMPVAFAQTFTDCDPTKETCPDADGLNQEHLDIDFTKGMPGFSAAIGTEIDHDDEGARFRIAKPKQAPTIESDWYVFFGRFDVVMKPAPGQGIVSSIVLESDDLDEIDWEFLGGIPNKVQTNFFGKGNTTSYDRMIEYDIENAQNDWHTYSLDWTAEKLDWIIDGTVVRTLNYHDSVANTGQNYPQTPMQLKLGNWAGGGEGMPEGTIEWAGGKTDYKQAPFDMLVKEVKITSYNPAESYTYGDKSGSWESIIINKDGTSKGGNSGSSSSSSSKSDDVKESSTSSAESASRTKSVEPIDKHTDAVPSITRTGGSYWSEETTTEESSHKPTSSAVESSSKHEEEEKESTSEAVPTTSTTPLATYVGSTTLATSSAVVVPTMGSNTTSPHQNGTTTGPGVAEQTNDNAGASLKGGVTVALVAGVAVALCAF